MAISRTLGDKKLYLDYEKGSATYSGVKESATDEAIQTVGANIGMLASEGIEGIYVIEEHILVQM